MQFNRPQIFIPLLIVVAALGFTAGTLAQAGGLGEPGSADDPLVAESYVNEVVDKNIGELQRQVVQLQERIEELRAKVALLEGRPGETRQPAPQTVEPSQDEVKPGPEKASQKGIVLPDTGANVRTGPDTQYGKITTFVKGTEVQIIAEKDGWFEIRLEEGSSGWIFGELVERK